MHGWQSGILPLQAKLPRPIRQGHQGAVGNYFLACTRCFSQVQLRDTLMGSEFPQTRTLFSHSCALIDFFFTFLGGETSVVVVCLA
jgi:hypothetical protein